jgi:NADPH2:quinone reductase
VKAAVQIAHGEIASSIEVRDVPTPRPGPGAILVRVRGTSLNRKDLFALQALSGPGIRPRPPLPHVNGGDCWGDVVEAGSALDGWSAGERVVLYGGLSCGQCEWCLAGEQTACLHYGMIGEQTWGAHAEYVCVPACNLERVPGDCQPDVLNCACGAWTTAWRALVTVARVRPGETVVIVGASGSVGSGAVRIAKLAGCRVIAVVGSATKVARAMEVGADCAIESARDGFAGQVLDLTGGRGAEIVLDSVGAATWRDSIMSLARFGRMAICGATSGDNPDISIRQIYQSHRRILGAPMGNRSDFRSLLRCLLVGQLKPVIHARLPLDGIQLGLRLLEERTFFGKVVIEP